MNPEIPVQPTISTPPQDIPPVPQETPKKQGNPTLTILSLFLIILVGIAVFLTYQNYQLQNKVIALMSTPTPSPLATIAPVPTVSPSTQSVDMPILTSPTSGSTVSSPLIISGMAPAVWINGGTFPVKLIDSQSNLVAQGDAKEVVKGSWKTTDPVSFSVTLPFSTTDSTGFLIMSANSSQSANLNINYLQIPLNF
jgi:hypothetical protein